MNERKTNERFGLMKRDSS